MLRDAFDIQGAHMCRYGSDPLSGPALRGQRTEACGLGLRGGRTRRSSLQFVAAIRPLSQWAIRNVYGGDPGRTDPKAYFAYGQGYARADVFFWVPIQIAGSVWDAAR